MPQHLTGRRVLIMGASSGIGFAAAEAFARAGADLALVARSEEGLEAAADAARALGVRAYVVPADLGTRAECERAVADAVAALGGLDLLVWNAASMVFGHFADVAPDDFDRTIDVTFLAAVNTVRAALPHLEAAGGDIVATGSLMTRVPLPTFGSYAAAKHALRGFLSSLRIELKEAGSAVSVSIVHPGAVDTPLWEHVSSATGVRRATRRTPTRRRSSPRRSWRAPSSRGRRSPWASRVARWRCSTRRRDPSRTGSSRLVDRFYSSGKDPAREPGGLWQGQGEGRAGGGHHGRPSLWAALRLGRF